MRLVWERERVLGSAVRSQRPSTHKTRCIHGFLSRVPTDVSFLRSGKLQFARSWLVMVGLCWFFVGFLLIVHSALRQAGDKLPTTLEFIDRKSREDTTSAREFTSYPGGERTT